MKVPWDPESSILADSHKYVSLTAERYRLLRETKLTQLKVKLIHELKPAFGDMPPEVFSWNVTWEESKMCDLK